MVQHASSALPWSRSRGLFIKRLTLIITTIVVVVPTASVGAPTRHAGAASPAASAPPTVSLNPNTGAQGDGTDVAACGFVGAPNTTPSFTVTFDDGTTLAKGIPAAFCIDKSYGFGSSAQNSVPVVVTIPANAFPGPHKVTATWSYDGQSGSAVYTVVVPAATPTPSATTVPSTPPTATPTPSAITIPTPSATTIPSTTPLLIPTPTLSATTISSPTPSATILSSPTATNTVQPTATLVMSPLPTIMAPTATNKATAVPVVTLIPTVTVAVNATATPPTLFTATTTRSSPLPVEPTSTATRPAPPITAATATPLPIAQPLNCQPSSAPGTTLSPGGAGKGASYSGGQAVLLHADGLPRNANIDLIFTGPRTRAHGWSREPLDYSPASVHARTDASGHLLAGLRLPDDLTSGIGQVIAVPHTLGAQGSPVGVLTLSRWAFRTAPKAAGVRIVVKGRNGKPVPGATVLYKPIDPSSGHVVKGASGCTGQTAANGVVAFPNVPAGAGHVTVPGAGVGTSTLAVPGNLTVVGSITSPLPGNRCANRVDALYDVESGVDGALSGVGPFGYFVSGIPTPDIFLALVSRANSPQISPEPIAARTPISLATMVDGREVRTVGRVISVARFLAMIPRGNVQGLTVALRVALQHYHGTLVAFTIDTGRLPAGSDTLSLETGHGLLGNTCGASYDVKVQTNLWSRDPYRVNAAFDPVGRRYQARGVLPSGVPLGFSAPVSFGWNATPIGPVTVPAYHAQFDNHADAGLDLDESMYTDGHWNTTVGGHAAAYLLCPPSGPTPCAPIFSVQLPPHSARSNGPTPDDVESAPLDLPDIPLADFDIYLFTLYIPPYEIPVRFHLGFGISGSAAVSAIVPGSRAWVGGRLMPHVTGQMQFGGELDFGWGAYDMGVYGQTTIPGISLVLRVPGGVTDPRLPLYAQFEAGAYFSFVTGICIPYDTEGCVEGSTHQWWSQQIPIFQGCIGNCPSASNLPAVALRATAAEARALHQAMTRNHGTLDLNDRSIPAPLRVRLRAALPKNTLVLPPRPFSAQPATAISPSGRQATLWVGVDGKANQHPVLRAKIDGGPTQTLATNSVLIGHPRVAWLGPNRATAVWVASTATRPQLLHLRDGLVRHKLTAIDQVVSTEELFGATWDGRGWSTPVQLTHDALADNEPALAADPVHGTATLLWVHVLTGKPTHDLNRRTDLETASYVAGRWSPSSPVVGTAGQGVRRPVLAADLSGHIAAAWVQGPVDYGRAVFAHLHGAHDWSPAGMAGVPDGAQSVSLAFDGQGRAVVAEDAVPPLNKWVRDGRTALWAARQDGAGRWSATQLGAGTAPQLARGAAGAVVLLASATGLTGSRQASGEPAITTLPLGGHWAGLMFLSGSPSPVGNLALAVNPVTGAAHVLAVRATSPSLPAAATLTDPATAQLPDGRMTVLEGGLGLSALDLAPGGRLALPQAAINLIPAHPYPGQRATLRVTVRNLGTTALRAGARVILRLTVQGKTRTRILHTLRPLAPGELTTLNATVAAPTSTFIATVSTGLGPVRMAVLGGPLAPRQVGTTPDKRAGQIVLNWVSAHDHDVNGYRVYRSIGAAGQAPLTLVGLAVGRLWVDTTARRGVAYSYWVAAVDRQGRESPLAAPVPATLR